MNRDEFIGKLQLCYFGDRNAFEEIVGVYDKQKEILDKIKEKTIQFKDDLKMNEKIAKEQKRSNDISIQLVGLRVNAILELLEEIE
jgi:hypothetical protein